MSEGHEAGGQKAADVRETGVALVGYGYWGPNLLRNYMELPGAWVELGLRQAARGAREGRTRAIPPCR